MKRKRQTTIVMDHPHQHRRENRGKSAPMDTPVTESMERVPEEEAWPMEMFAERTCRAPDSAREWHFSRPMKKEKSTRKGRTHEDLATGFESQPSTVDPDGGAAQGVVTQGPQRGLTTRESRTTVEPVIPEGWRGERGADGKNAHTRVIQTQGNRRVCKKRQVAARGQGHIVQLPQEGPTGCSQGKKVEWQRK